jgi:hypothetical protein
MARQRFSFFLGKIPILSSMLVPTVSVLLSLIWSAMYLKEVHFPPFYGCSWDHMSQRRLIETLQLSNKSQNLQRPLVLQRSLL